MNFTQYSQLLSYIQSDSRLSVIDMMGQPLQSDADLICNIAETSPLFLDDELYDVMMFRFALSQIVDPFPYLLDVIQHLKPDGYMILQDYVLPNNTKVTDYINGFIHVFDKNHQKSFAQYAWDGLLLDVGLHIKQLHHQLIPIPLQNWLDQYQPDSLAHQHAQIMLVQAPKHVSKTMKIQYAGTSFAEFELQELVCVAQKEL